MFLKVKHFDIIVIIEASYRLQCRIQRLMRGGTVCSKLPRPSGGGAFNLQNIYFLWHPGGSHNPPPPHTHTHTHTALPVTTTFIRIRFVFYCDICVTVSDGEVGVHCLNTFRLMGI